MKRIICAFLISMTGVQAAEPGKETRWSERASNRAALILERVDQVSIEISPAGPALRGEGLPSLILVSADHPFHPLKGKADPPHGFLLDEKEMRTFVEALADAGILDGASHYNPSLKKMREPFRPKGYAIRISSRMQSPPWVMELDLGCDLNTIKTLETLRKGLSGEASKAMGQLIEKMQEHVESRKSGPQESRSQIPRSDTVRSASEPGLPTWLQPQG